MTMPRMNPETLEAFECDVIRRSPLLWCTEVIDSIGDNDPVFLQATTRVAKGMAGKNAEIAAFVAGSIQFGALYAYEALRTQFEVDELNEGCDTVDSPNLCGGAGI